MNTTKAGDWHAARRKGVRLPQHMLPDDEPQELFCELCGEEATANDFCATVGMVICPRCVETELENACASH
jgi:formylmethanofuran dehydrogenase subunit E